MRDWHTYAPSGEPWFGFEALRALDGLPPDILLVPLRGHTLGHAGVAVNTGDGWLLDAGDAYVHHSELALSGSMPPGLALYEWIMTTDAPAARSNLGRLRDLWWTRSNGVQIFCSHDTDELKAFQSPSWRS